MKFGLSIAFSEPEDYSALAQAAEANGFDAVSLADHLIYPKAFSVPYPYTPDGVPRFSEMDHFPDPWIAITAMAAVTSTLNFYTNVFVLPTRNPVHVAKILATSSVFCQGRIGLGIGMGWMPEEFAAGGEDFKRRGKRADEMIEVMKKLWTGDMVEHQGEFYQFEPVRMLPTPKAYIPVYVGGFSKPALRRAAHNDGWIADLHTLAELEALIDQLAVHRQDAGSLDKDFQIMSFGCLDAIGAEGYKAMQSLGVTTATTMPWVLYGESMTTTLAKKTDAIKRFADEVIGSFK